MQIVVATKSAFGYVNYPNHEKQNYSLPKKTGFKFAILALCILMTYHVAHGQCDNKITVFNGVQNFDCTQYCHNQ